MAYGTRAHPWASQTPRNGPRFRKPSPKMVATVRGHWNESTAKKVFGEIVDYAKRALGPAQRNQIFAKNIALRETCVLDDLTQFHVVDHFHAQRAIGADRVIDVASNHVEGAHTHVIARFWVSDFPGTMSENEERLEKCDHHSLAPLLHDHAGEKYHVIRLFCLGISNRTPHRIRLEQHIRIGEEQPVSSRVVTRSPHGVSFAHPTRGQLRNMNHLESWGADALVRDR